MGVSSSPRELAAKLDKLGRDMANPKVPLEATALHIKRLFEASAAKSGALGRKPKDKRKVIGARYDFNNRKSNSIGEGSVVITYTGPAHLLNNPTRPHRIEPRRPRGVRTRRRRGAGALVINGSVRMWANHPGTRGKHFFEPAAAAAKATAPRVYAQKGLTEPLRKVF